MERAEEIEKKEVEWVEERENRGEGGKEKKRWRRKRKRWRRQTRIKKGMQKAEERPKRGGEGRGDRS